jgi:hypothetical protein
VIGLWSEKQNSLFLLEDFDAKLTADSARLREEGVEGIRLILRSVQGYF